MPGGRQIIEESDLQPSSMAPAGPIACLADRANKAWTLDVADRARPARWP